MDKAMATRPDAVSDASSYVRWPTIIAGAVAGAAVAFVLMAFAAAIGLAVASPSPTWRDASAWLALLSGVWVLMVQVFSFALAGYIAGRMRTNWLVSMRMRSSSATGCTGCWPGRWA